MDRIVLVLIMSGTSWKCLTWRIPSCALILLLLELRQSMRTLGLKHTVIEILSPNITSRLNTLRMLWYHASHRQHHHGYHGRPHIGE